MERKSSEQIMQQAVLSNPRGSERFSLKVAINGGIFFGILGFGAGISLVLAASNLGTINLLSYSVVPLILGIGFGGLGFIGGGILGRSTS